MRSSWICLFCLALALVVGWAQPRTAMAQNDTELQVARDKFQKALALQTGGDWAGALALLKEVAAVRSTPQVRFNIALCEENLGQLVAAVGDYELAAADAAQKSGESEVIEQAQRRLAQLAGRIPKVVVERGRNADTATITLDGVTLGDQVIGKEMNVDPGPHVITARATGFGSFRATVRIEEAETRRITVSLSDPPPKPPVQGQISPMGPRAQPDHARLGGYIAGGVGVASFATAGVMYALSQSEEKKLDRACDGLKCPPDQGLQATRRSGRRYTMLTNIGVGVGALGVGLGAYLLFLYEEEPDTGFTLTAPNSIAGCSYRGQF